MLSTRRLGRLVLCAVLSAVPLTGCQSITRSGLFNPAGSDTPAGGNQYASELTQDQSAKVCVTTAIELDRGGKETEAIALYERARQLDGRNQVVCRRLAVLYDRQANYTKAAEEYEKAVKLSPRDADLLNDLGYFYYVRGQWTQAEEHLRKALAINAQHARAWTNLGMTLAQQGRNQDSLEAFSRVVPPAQAHCNLAFILQTQGKREEAKQAYRSALTFDPGLTRAQQALAKLDTPRPASAPQAASHIVPAIAAEPADDQGPIHIPGPARK